jgi:ferredoxin
VSYRVEVTWPDDRADALLVAADETVLEAAEAAGVGLPFGCRTGACSTCTGRLREGRVAHRKPPIALKERHLEQGYVLLCLAEPRSDCEIAVGTAVQSELVSNPWK